VGFSASRLLGTLINSYKKKAPFSVSQCAVTFRQVPPVLNETLLHYFTASAHQWKKRARDHYAAKITATDTTNRIMFRPFLLYNFKRCACFVMVSLPQTWLLVTFTQMMTLLQ
jgi:hypothetical protein